MNIIAHLIKEGYKEIDELDNLTTEIISHFANKNFPIVNRIHKRRNNNYNFNLDGDYLNNIIKNKTQYNLINNIIDNNLYISWFDNIKYSHFNNKPFQIKLKYPNKNFIENLNYNISIADKDPDDNSISKENAIRILKTSLGVAYRSVIIHELEHAYDHLISKGNFDKDKKSKNFYKKWNQDTDINSEQFQEYLNLPHEYKARFSEFLSDNKYQFKKDFNHILNLFKNNNKMKYNRIINDKDKKKLIKNLYKYWYIKQNENK